MRTDADIRALAQAVLDQPSTNGTGPDPDPIFIDWVTFWQRDQTQEDWLIWPLVPRGRGVALYAPAKAGKSLIVLALAAAAATGKPALNGNRREPVEVIYLDYEMTLDDLQERLEDLGYGPDDDLSRLHYASLPSLPPLNDQHGRGAQALLDLIRSTGAELVIIDTLGRAVVGEENSNDTVQDFYMFTGLRLKAAGIAYLRTDHAGKDLSKGQRGGSAKNDDVDVVWQLTRTQTGVALRATHQRISWIPETVKITVSDDNGWSMSLAESEPYPPKTDELAALLDSLEVPVDASYPTANKAIKAISDDGKGRSKTLILAAQRWRRNALPMFTDLVGNRPGTGAGTGLATMVPEPVPGTTETNHDLPGMEPVPEPVGTTPADKGVPGSPPIRGNRSQSHPSEVDSEDPF